MDTKALTSLSESLVQPIPEGMLPLSDFDEYHINMSGGKDSICIALLMIYGYKVPKEQIKLIHMDVDAGKEPLFDWPQTRPYLDYLAEKLDLDLVIIHGKKGLEERIRDRGKWPAPGQQYCTSSIKREVYAKWARGRGDGKYLCVSGERAAESPRRATKPLFEIYEPAHRVGLRTNRIVHWFRPALHVQTDQVWELMRLADIKPHPAYELGMSRCSCRFCIFLSPNELKRVSELYPDEFKRIEDMEIKMDHTMRWEKGKPLPIRDFIAKANPLDNLDIFSLPCMG